MIGDVVSSRKDKSKGDRPLIRRVIIKFKDGIGLPYDLSVDSYLKKQFPDPWKILIEAFPWVTIQPLFRKLGPDKLAKLIDQAHRNNPAYQSPDFLSYFVVRVPTDIKPQVLTDFLNDKKGVWASLIVLSYLESGSEKPPSTEYLNPAQMGIDVASAWSAGSPGKGKGMTFIDIEQGWGFGDASLPEGLALIHGCNWDYVDHGTAVLSIVAGHGLVQGIAPESRVRVASQISKEWDEDTGEYALGFCETSSVHTALQVASAYLFDNGQQGDIILIEAQTDQDLLPVEVELAVFDLIKLITNAGYVVIEPAGNSGESVTVQRLSGEAAGEGVNISPFLLGESGAILVGAGMGVKQDHPWVRQTNFGNRLDCFGWGSDITAAGQGSNGQFGGTSGASAIIAGIALSIQGIALETYGRCYKPWVLRMLLQESFSESGSSQLSGKVLPNLDLVVASIATTPP